MDIELTPQERDQILKQRQARDPSAGLVHLFDKTSGKRLNG
jgi:hypothetical protein